MSLQRCVACEERTGYQMVPGVGLICAAPGCAVIAARVLAVADVAQRKTEQARRGTHSPGLGASLGGRYDHPED